MKLYFCNKTDKNSSPVREKFILWLFILCLMIVLIILIGGLTRLTGSGLSITKWNIVTGIIPPINHQDWVKLFDLYMDSFEYQKINWGMTLVEFKQIFWLEYLHRLFARIISFIFFIGLIFLYFSKNQKSIKLKPFFTFCFILLILQAVMGWYMVKSGLSENAKVSHLRLSFHLIFAFILYYLLLNKLFAFCVNKIYIKNNAIIKLTNILIIFLFLQIFLGAINAGLNSAMIYNSFPLMGGSFAPEEFSLISYTDFLNNPAIMQFFHRILAYIILILCSFLAFNLHKIQQYKIFIILVATTIFQILTGIITILYQKPLIMAFMHQFGAVLMLSVFVFIKNKNNKL